MSNIIDFTKRRESLKRKNIEPGNDIEIALSILDRDFAENLVILDQKMIFMKTLKGVLKSRHIKYRISTKELQSTLNKKTTLLFIDEKIGFNLDITATEEPCKAWKIYPLNVHLNPAESAGIIINKLNEVRQNGRN
ncbi:MULTISPECIES: hypothetical protein [unclassified Pseudomonas]|jgi:hypothetical protein|uniref:hypothetical protein n=1 Tax=unclassified Pseudomonas TaxID=196821 RepID=UPI001C87C561|nr:MULTISPECIES: hypothetical protein [unclassified Pseudomonas]MBX8470613.1 hypothetical protein [Pseudomonas sp. RIT778]UVM27257.1 hypothetical protein LOY31_28185 [Pseudomonas sp. B21-021]